MVLLVVRWIAGNLKKVSRFAGALSEGDFTVEKLNLKGRDELAYMGASLNEMYEKNKAVFYSLISVVIYYVLIKAIGDKILLHAIYIIPIIWISGTYLLYSKTIKKEY